MIWVANLNTNLLMLTHISQQIYLCVSNVNTYKQINFAAMPVADGPMSTNKADICWYKCFGWYIGESVPRPTAVEWFTNVSLTSGPQTVKSSYQMFPSHSLPRWYHPFLPFFPILQISHFILLHFLSSPLSRLKWEGYLLVDSELIPEHTLGTNRSH